MRSKKPFTRSIVFTEKNKEYLGRAGFLDLRTNKTKRPSKVTLNQFVNNCITLIIELGLHPGINKEKSKKYQEMFIKHEIGKLNTQIFEIKTIINNKIKKLRELKKK